MNCAYKQASSGHTCEIAAKGYALEVHKLLRRHNTHTHTHTHTHTLQPTKKQLLLTRHSTQGVQSI